MNSHASNRPADWQERLRAVDISRSCIVQAPAGSGKTELLVQRTLALLAVAEKPEEILSITFTRKAAGEMRLRLLNALQEASSEQPPEEEHARETWLRARSVLDRDAIQGWNLLQNPSRLQLMTIDSFCAYLTRRMPWMSRFGEQPGVTDDPDEIYRIAIENLLTRLERNVAGHAAIELLLVHLDNRLPLLRDLLVAMLGKRDQWLRHLSGQSLDKARDILEHGLSLYVSGFLANAYLHLGAENYRELRELALFAAHNQAEASSGMKQFALLNEQEDHNSVEQWLELTELALTASGSVRKSVNKTNGFPADKTQPEMEMRARAQRFLDSLRDNDAAVNCLQDLCKLPATSYEDRQWAILQALIGLLPLAAYELREVFRSKGVVDFIEVAGAARAALGNESSPEELLLQLDGKIRHVLVDEFQDTSFVQYELLNSLTAGWCRGDGRTLFVVGDPMQSIYRFREAEVGLYLHVCQYGLNNLPMERIVLNTNFRSNKAIVNWSNKVFAQLFPAEANTLNGAVPYSTAIAFDQSESTARLSFHSFLNRQDEQEAQAVATLVSRARKEGDVAVLVRSRGQLTEIVRALKNAGISYQAQDIDPLTHRPAVQDVLSLTKALYRPADRVSWLAVLRAPWCGLTLSDLTVLCGHDSRATIWELMTQNSPQGEMFDPLSADGRVRLDRIKNVLKGALENVGRISIRALVESAWLRLGGPACCSEDDLQDTEQVFDLLENLAFSASLDDFETQLGKLFAAPAPLANPDVQLMTIHKAKGLEFDTVILPGLGRGVRGDDRTLLRWLEHPEYELLLAPIPPLLSDEKEATYEAIGHIQKTRSELETVRLLYVAATRAKSNLCLLGHVSEDAQGEYRPLSGSLLSVLWPACRDDFLQELALAPAAEVVERPHQKIRRLPSSWSLPAMPSARSLSRTGPEMASGGDYFDQGINSRMTEEGKVIGTLVHEYLEVIATEGVDQWSKARVNAEIKTINNRLALNGIPGSRLDDCVRDVQKCLINALNSKRGKWLLHSHDCEACELPVNGLVGERLVHATIDRTFVCEDGVRWIVDYKTSQPGRAESIEAFLGREKIRYQQQLETYRDLMKRLYPDREIRVALYFPSVDVWVEYP